MSEPIHITDLLPRLLPDGGRVLDIGCGDGKLVHWLTERGFDAVGVDPQVGAASARNGMIQGGAEHLPVEAGSFQAALMVNSLHHVPVAQMDRALGEAAYALKPGGRLIVIEPLPQGDWFELLRPVEDETEIRRAAADALALAHIVGFVRAGGLAATGGANPYTFSVERRVADVDAVLAGFSQVDPKRAAKVEAAREVVARQFGRTGQPVADGRSFLQPLRADVFDLPEERAVVRFAHDGREIAAALDVRNAVFCGVSRVSRWRRRSTDWTTSAITWSQPGMGRWWVLPGCAPMATAGRSGRSSVSPS